MRESRGREKVHQCEGHVMWPHGVWSVPGSLCWGGGGGGGGVSVKFRVISVTLVLFPFQGRHALLQNWDRDGTDIQIRE